MNALVLAVVGLRAAALAVSLAGKTSISDKLFALADLVEAGKATDEHMALVTEKLRNRTIVDADWDDVMARIEADSAQLQDGVED
jgi:hypothetical protein